MDLQQFDFKKTKQKKKASCLCYSEVVQFFVVVGVLLLSKGFLNHIEYIFAVEFEIKSVHGNQGWTNHTFCKFASKSSSVLPNLMFWLAK